VIATGFDEYYDFVNDYERYDSESAHYSSLKLDAAKRIYSHVASLNKGE
jgi:hypothetical protein